MPATRAAKNLKPYQGLKQLDRVRQTLLGTAAKNLKPYQGLKRIIAEACSIMPDSRAAKNLKPYQGLKLHASR